MSARSHGRSSLNLKKFRLRSFANPLVEMGEMEVHDDPVPLAALSGIIEASNRAYLFRKAGPQQF